MTKVAPRRRARKNTPPDRNDDDLKAAIAAGFIILPARDTGVVELYGPKRNVIRFDPAVPSVTRAPKVAQILAGAVVDERARAEAAEEPALVSVLALHYTARYGMTEGLPLQRRPSPSARIAGLLAADVEHGGDSPKTVATAFRCALLEGLTFMDEADDVAKTDLVHVLMAMDDVCTAETAEEGRRIAAENYSDTDHPIANRALMAAAMVMLNGRSGSWPAWSTLFVALVRLGELLDFMGEGAAFEGPAFLDRFALDFLELLAVARLAE